MKFPVLCLWCKIIEQLVDDYMGDKFILGGYYIVIPVDRPEWMDKGLVPEKIITISDCICDVVPGIWGLNWVKNREKQIERFKKILSISDSEFTDLENWVTNKFDDGSFGWQNGFSRIETAKEFRERYMLRVKESYILAIGLSEKDVDFFLNDQIPQGKMGETIVYSILKKKSVLEPKNVLGFDILGYDLSIFHSYLCNGLEKVYYNEFGISPNKNGFFDVYEDAAKLANYTLDGHIGAEPALWQPWLVCIAE